MTWDIIQNIKNILMLMLCIKSLNKNNTIDAINDEWKSIKNVIKIINIEYFTVS